MVDILDSIATDMGLGTISPPPLFIHVIAANTKSPPSAIWKQDFRGKRFATLGATIAFIYVRHVHAIELETEKRAMFLALLIWTAMGDNLTLRQLSKLRFALDVEW